MPENTSMEKVLDIKQTAAQSNAAENKGQVVVECPNCSYPIVAGKHDSTARCPCCNSVVNVLQPKTEGEAFQKIADIKTLSAAQAYIDYIFETYDWEAFSMDASTFSIPEVDALLDNMKTTQGDNPETWKLCYIYRSKCIEKKIDNVNAILDRIIAKYIEGDDHGSCYNDFDMLLEGINILKWRRFSLIDELITDVNYAEKFGLDKTEGDNLKEKAQALGAQIDSIALVNSLDDHPRIAEENEKRMNSIKQAYSDAGIDADAEYDAGVAAYESDNFDEALDRFSRIPDYREAQGYIDKINYCAVLKNKYFYMNGKVFFYNNGLCYEKGNLADYAHPESLPFKRFLGCYGTKFYYLAQDSEAVVYYQHLNLREAAKKGPRAHIVPAYGSLSFEQLMQSRPNIAVATARYDPVLNAASKQSFCKSNNFHSELKVNKKINYGNNWHDLLAFDMKNATFTVLVEGIHKIVNIVGDIIYYIAPNPEYKKNNVLTGFAGTGLYSYNFATKEIRKLITGDSRIEKINSDQSIIFTRCDHGKNNLTIYTKNSADDAEDSVVVRNVYQFYKVIKGKIYYLVGNANIKSLCSINPDGTDRVEVMKYMMDIVFTSGDYIYITRGESSNYYRTLFRIPLDGGKPQKVAFGVRYTDLLPGNIKISHGYLYYTNCDRSLCRVRLNGTGQQELVQGVNQIMLIGYDKVFYLSYDGTDNGKDIISLYNMNMDGSNRVKLIYNVDDIKRVDDRYLIYIRDEHLESKRELYGLVTDPKLVKQLNKMYAKFDKKHKYPHSDFDTVSLYDCETGDSSALAYDAAYPDKKSLKLEMKEVLRG